MRNSFLVCYDIREDKRLRAVFKSLRGYGEHLQYSIFECQLNQADLARCKAALSRIIDHREDQVLFVDLGPADGRAERVITSLGQAYARRDAPCLVVDPDADAAGERTSP